MSRWTRAFLPGAVLALLTLAAAAQPQPNGQSLAARLLAAERAPLQDPDAGKLYPAAAALLASARDLPSDIELVHPAIPAKEEQPKPAAASPAAPQQPTAPPWPQVVKGAVVDNETLAHARFLAGDYAGAADLYARLHEEQPDEVYFTQMLFLSKRNAGDIKGAAPLLDELKAKPESREWADWVSAMLALGEDAKEEK